MAQQDVQSLFLQVDASVELLRRRLAEGEQPLDRFEKRASRMAESVDRSIGELGKRFPNLAQAAESAAQRIEKSFQESFDQVQRAAAKAVQFNITSGGGLDIGAGDARAAAEAAQQRAKAAALIEQAAIRAAAGEGVLTRETQAYLKAAAAARIEADQQAAALVRQAGALEQVEIELQQAGAVTELYLTTQQKLAIATREQAEAARQSAAAEAASEAKRQGLAAQAVALRNAIDPMYAAQQRFDAELERADALLRANVISQREYQQAVLLAKNTLRDHAQQVAGTARASQALVPVQRRVTEMTGQARAGMQQLSFQLNDVAVGFAAGTPAMIIFAQQSGQVIQALQLMSGQAKGFLGFLGGPWGMAITSAMIVLTPFAAKLFESGDALDKAVKKLKEDAEATATAERAKKIYNSTLQGHIALQKQLSEELDRQLKTQRELNREKLDAMRVKASEAATKSSETQSELMRAELRLAELQREQRSPPMLDGPDAAQAWAAQMARDIAAADAAVKRLRGEVIAARQHAVDAQRDAAKAMIPIARDNAAIAIDPLLAIEAKYEGLERAAEKRAIAEGWTQKALEDQLKAYKAQENAERAIAQSQQQRAKASVAPGRVTPDEVGRGLVEQFGGTVTSTTGGKHAAKSYHYAGQAVDFVPKGGMGAVSKAQIREWAEGQGLKIKELLGPGDRDHDDHFHLAFEKTRRSQEDIARREEAARIKVLRDDNYFNEQERAARHRLLEATRKTAASEERRDQLLRDDINADADARNKRTGNDMAEGRISAAEGEKLMSLNEANRKQRLQNVDLERASAVLRQQADLAVQSLDEQIAMLELESGFVDSARERRAVELRILDLQIAREKQINDAIILDGQANKEAQEAASRRNAAIDARAPLQRADVIDRTSGPAERYRDQLRRAVGSANAIDETLEGIRADGLRSLEDGLVGIISGTESVADAFGRMANQIIADLARIAVQKLILESIGGLGGAIGGPKAGGSAAFNAAFAGFRASGGPVEAGKSYMVGEKGPELFIPQVSGTILANGGSRGGTSISMPVTINAPGATAETVAMIRRELAAAAPTLIAGAKAATVASLSRPRLS